MTAEPTVSDAPHTTWTPRPPDDADAADLAEAFRRMILHPDYPCLGARSVMNRHRASVLVLPRLGSRYAGRQLLGALTEFAAATDIEDGFASFVAIFREPERTDEEGFERLLWRQLQCIGDADSAPWSGLVSDDPDDPHFSVDCPACEPHLAHDPLWAATPIEVPLTPAEQQEADKKQREAELVTAQWAQAMATAAAANIGAQPPAAAAAPVAKARRTRKTSA